MTEQNKVRPFAVGDFMVIKIGGHKTFVEKVSEINYPIIFTQKDGFSSHGYHEEYITAIRSERKGGKEARDIVAMFAKIYRQKLTDILDTYKYLEMNVNDYWKIRKTKGYYPFALEKAKLMLGASYE